MIKPLLADLDGTLVETWRETPLPGIPDRLAELRAQGVTMATVTYQGGVGYRYAHEQRTTRHRVPNTEDGFKDPMPPAADGVISA